MKVKIDVLLISLDEIAKHVFIVCDKKEDINILRYELYKIP